MFPYHKIYHFRIDIMDKFLEPHLTTRAPNILLQFFFVSLYSIMIMHTFLPWSTAYYAYTLPPKYPITYSSVILILC